MSSHALAIAKASLAAGMIRPDPISIPRAEITHFHVLLETMLKQCSSKNIQLCKEWLLKNIIPSAARTVAVGKYLVALSDSFTKTTGNDESKPSKEQGPPGRRRQLHILYLMNDLVHHTRYHSDSSSTYSNFTSDISSYLMDLFRFASSCNPETYPNQHRKIQELLDIWENNVYYQSSYIEELRETVSTAPKPDDLDTGRGSKTANGTRNEALGEEKKDAPFIMPASHGDPSTPFYDLPAGNILPHIMPNSLTPINPQLVKPLQFVSGPADEGLVAIVKDFLRKAETLDDSGFGDEEIDVDLDEMGQCVLRDEITGDILEGDGYYGWSRAFCEKMKRRGEGVEDFAKPIRTTNESLDRSLSPRKRRRYSGSGRSPSIGTGRSSSSDSRDGRRYGPRSRSRSRSASMEKRQYRSLRSPSRSKSRSPSYSPPQMISAFQQPSLVNNAPPSSQAHPQGSSPPPPPFPHPFSQGFPIGPGGIPIPPPPPPNYQGQWPPPPPPMPNSAPTGPPMFVPPSPQLLRPRTYHKQRGALSMQGPQSSVPGQAPPHSGSWEQQSGYGSGNLQGGLGRGPSAYNGNAQIGRGNGFGRGGWVRQR